MVESIGIYVHFPFCERKCWYCDFVSYGRDSGLHSLIPRYVETLCREIKLWGEKIDSLPVTSLFFGGGTPTLVPARDLESVLETIDKSFTLAADAEVTIEANPGTVSPSLLGDLRAMGINRLSLGIQSFDDQVLKRLGRGHTALQGLEACNWARAQGFSNLSLDLMFAVPGQNLESWEETLAITTELAPEHVSAYSLIVEEDTPYGQWCQQGLLDVPSEDLWADMMELTEARLASAGLERYEISNYARRGFESRHNQIYWRNGPYLGFGAGAHSYWQQRRWANTSDVTRYIRDFAVTGAPVAGEETLDLPGQMGETVMLGLRLLRGVDLAEFRRRFGRDLLEVYAETVEELVELGLVEVTPDGYLRLTARGLELANQVMARFV